MQRLPETFILLFSVISFIKESNSLAFKPPPLWSWECVNEKCVPVKVTQTQDNLQSLETCNVLCSDALLWPLPTGPVSLTMVAVPVRTDFFQMELELEPTNVVRQHLRDVFQLFKQDLRNMEGNRRSLGESHNVIVRLLVNDSEVTEMRLDTDESYKLSLAPVSSTTILAEIEAISFCGARHALETLSQLVWLDHYLGSLLIIQEAIINDKPRFGYRGLMIDTARNHIPFSELLRTVDAMAASKLNTLHWHASDSQAFSVHFDSVPELAHYGTNSPSDIYTTDQVKALVRRARLRGIRVIIEVDTPAHVNPEWNWGPQNEDNIVQCVDSELSNSFCETQPCGQLNPFKPEILDTLQNIYSEIIRLTGVDDIFHLGGDDVSESCWAKHFNGSDPMAVWQDYTRTLLQRLEYVNEKLPNLTLFWPSRLSERMKTDLKDLNHLMGLQMRTPTWAEKHVSGIRLIVSHEDAWDLNNGFGAWYDDKSKTPFNSWQRFYEHRPWVKSDSGNIVGGEATLWSWTVGEGGLDARVWPRAAALAERLWTDRAEGATRKVYVRLDFHRARLAVRGVECGPIWSHWCTQNPYTCS